jgi:DNA-binding MarR family transcriptional regulator
MVTVEVTSSRCAADLLDTLWSIMRFIRNKVKDQTGSTSSMAQVRVLGFLHEHPGASLSKLAEHLGVSSATASATVDRLVQRKLIERTEHPHERRFVELKLSILGTAHFQELHQFAVAELARTLSPLPEKKVLKVMEAMAILREAFPDPRTKDSNI